MFVTFRPGVFDNERNFFFRSEESSGVLVRRIREGFGAGDSTGVSQMGSGTETSAGSGTGETRGSSFSGDFGASGGGFDEIAELFSSSLSCSWWF